MTKSDDGSVLVIGDRKVVDNDGSHASVMATGRVALEAGLHPYTLMYFEDYEGRISPGAGGHPGRLASSRSSRSVCTLNFPIVPLIKL